MKLAGKRAVVTGAAQSIGAAIARRLAADGARLALLDMEAQVALPPGDHLAMICDVADSRAVNSAFEQIGEAFGGVDILVNNAAVGQGPQDGTLEMFAALAERDRQLEAGERPTSYPDQLIHMSDEGGRMCSA